jgi:phage-related protein
MKAKFDTIFLEEANDFLDDLDEKPRDKVLYNIWKSTQVTDNELFKKLQGDIWEFRTLYQKTYYRLFAFWDKENEEQTLVVATHGIIKKTGKTPKTEIEHAENLRKKYFKNKNEKK